MSRLWIDRLHVYLHPEQVILVRQAGLFRPKVTAKRVIAVNDSGEHAWSGALVVLKKLLELPEWQRARVRVSLSSHFVRYRTVPWNGGLSPEERDALLRHRFEEIYGSEMRAWQLVVSESGYGKQGLACAIDSGLMAGVKNCFTHSSVKLVSVTPVLMSVCNRWRKEIDVHSAWLVLAEQSHFMIALIQNGEWRGIRRKPCQPGWEDSLELLLQREGLQLGVDAAAIPVYCCWPDKPYFKPNLQQSVRILRLPGQDGFSPDGDKDIAIALC